MTATDYGVKDTPILASCICDDDPQLQLLRDLMNRGMRQWDASQIAFGHHPSDRASRDVWSTWARLEARRIGNGKRRQLGLPELPLLEAVA